MTMFDAITCYDASHKIIDNTLGMKGFSDSFDSLFS